MGILLGGEYKLLQLFVIKVHCRKEILYLMYRVSCVHTSVGGLCNLAVRLNTPGFQLSILPILHISCLFSRPT